MSSSFGSYEIARSGLYVNERGLFVTGHNMANVNTPGYVRQQAIIKNGPVQSYYAKNGLMQMGLGADIQETRQIRHTFLDNIYRQENTALGYWDARQKTLQDVQAIIGEPFQAGLQNVMNQFWDSWQELSLEPESLTKRAVVRQRGEALADQLNHMGIQFDNLQKDLNTELTVRIDEINQITSQIAQLNVTIMRYEVSGDSANDYRDQRNLLIDKLTRMADVVVSEMQDGGVDITLGGYFLVHKAESTNLYAGKKDPGGSFYVPMLEGTNIEVPVKSGVLKGLLESRDVVVADMKTQLNKLVQEMMTEINKVHSSGKTLGDSPEDGGDFFVVKNSAKPLEMGNIQINPIFSDLNKIAASKSGASGDNTNALEIANIRSKAFISDTTGILSPDDYYQSIVLNMANTAAEADRIFKSQEKFVQSVDANRTAVSGVSMDEEMTNMMKFKFAYDAASRVLNIIDTMTDTIINRMGLAGR